MEDLLPKIAAGVLLMFIVALFRVWNGGKSEDSVLPSTDGIENLIKKSPVIYKAKPMKLTDEQRDELYEGDEIDKLKD